MPVSRAPHLQGPPGGLHLFCGDLPHHAGAVLGVLELLNERRDVRLVALGEDGVHHRLAQVEVLDPLGRPVGRHVGHGHAPDLLGVGLEEDAVETPPEAGHEPVLVVGLVLGGADARPQVGEPAQDRLPQPQVAQGVEGLERVVVELALVVDPAHAGPEHEVALGQDLVPEGLHLGDLGEEAVSAQVEAPAVAHHRAADAAHHVVGLEHDGVLPPFGQEIRRRQPPGTGAGDDDGRCLRGRSRGRQVSGPPRNPQGGWWRAPEGRRATVWRPPPGGRRVRSRRWRTR